ncbi:MAG: HAMP domain-containing histidine kinase [Phycisphaerales bacterium]|nr:HAMP domain-containing histidine kinase [Phycisphaerales bacterium]
MQRLHSGVVVEQPVASKTLSRRITIANSALICAIIAIGASVALGLFALMSKVELAVDEYEEVRLLDRASDAVDRARLRLRLRADQDEIVADLEEAEQRMDVFVTYQSGEELIEEDHQEQERELARSILADLTTVSERLKSGDASAGGDGDGDVEAVLERAADRLVSLASATDVSEVRSSALQRARLTAISVVSMSAAIIVAAIVVSVSTHRRLVGALDELRRGARRVATGHFAERLSESGDREIADLAADFNQMASELDTLYRVMEARVDEKSRELVRSERLASVGFLAAGVAHEINNPLGIIAGYAELSRKWIAGRPSEGQLNDTRGALEAIREEAFRCKDIVGQLMTLSRPGDNTYESVCLAEVARDIVSLVRGLERARSRKISFVPPSGDATVTGNAAELRQVALNLIINAVDATSPDSGEIRISLETGRRMVRMIVADNGRGMTDDTRHNVFEPFYSARSARPRESGMGLGLTISYAIVEAHGGRLLAESDGVDRGSRFIVELPVAPTETSHHEL